VVCGCVWMWAQVVIADCGEIKEGEDDGFYDPLAVFMLISFLISWCESGESSQSGLRASGLGVRGKAPVIAV